MAARTSPLVPIDPSVGETWDEAVQQFDEHTIFHRSAWARVLIEAYGHRPCYFQSAACLLPLMEVKSRITGIRGISLPFADFAGPLWRDGSQAEDIYQSLVEIAAARNWKHVEIRDDRVPPPLAAPVVSYETHELDLRSGVAEIERKLAPATRRAIRKAARSELRVTLERSSQSVFQFYDLHGRTRRRNGLPPQPKKFFQAIATHLIQKDLGFVMLARIGSRPVAGAVFLRSKKHAIYKFGASDPEFWSLRPNQAVMWQAISHLADTGCEQLNFGRTARSDEGLRHFKLSWGSTTRPLHYFRHARSGWLPSTGEPKESHPLVFSHLPLALNRLAGQLIYPHLD